MLGIAYFKGQPTDFVIEYVRGRPLRQGRALSFYYLRHSTSIVVVPTAAIEAGFVFNETTANFQDVTLQGTLGYRITDPDQAAQTTNFAVNPRDGRYLSEDPERLRGRVTTVVRTETRRRVERLALEDVLTQTAALARDVVAAVRDGSELAAVGAELLSLHFLAAKPTPEVGKALEADYRESLLRRSDEAIYARRAAAVEEERKIKQNELDTDIALERERQRLIELQGANLQREAEVRGRALELEAEYRGRVRELEAQHEARATEVESEARAAALGRELAAYGEVDPAKLVSVAARDLVAVLPDVAARLQPLAARRSER
jgi:hypothetical protein